MTIATTYQNEILKSRGEVQVLTTDGTGYEHRSLGLARKTVRNSVAAYVTTKQGLVRLGEYPNTEEACCKIAEWHGQTVVL